MRKILLLLAIFMGFSFLAFSQTRAVTGTVTDSAGAAIPFATVTVKGTNTAVSADADGKFSINAADGDVLVFSATGYEPTEATVDGNTMQATLNKGEGQIIDEVVGYGVQKRKDVTGSIASVDVDNLKNLAMPSIDKQLQGQVSAPSGILGQPARIRVRGTNSISSSADPLYVVDGVPYISGDQGTIGS